MRAYGTVAAFLLLAGMVSTGIYALGTVLGPRTEGSVERLPFESGAGPAVHAWNRYHIRYYPFALLFLAFDRRRRGRQTWPSSGLGSPRSRPNVT